MEEEKTWAWLMPNGETCTVVTNPKDGTVKLYDEDGKLGSKYENPREEAVRIIEKNYLKKVATQTGGIETERVKGAEENLEIAMYIR